MDNLGELAGRELAEEAKSAPLEGEKGWTVLRELLGGVEDGAVAAHGDDVGDDGLVECGIEYVTVVVGEDEIDFLFGVLVHGVEDGGGEADELQDGVLDEFEDLVFFVDAANQQHTHYIGVYCVHLFYDVLCYID